MDRLVVVAISLQLVTHRFEIGLMLCLLGILEVVSYFGAA
jgi:hypothetical protein